MISEKLSILSADDWKNFYPSANYKKTAHGNDYSFHYFLALAKKGETVINYIQNTCKNPATLTKKDSKSHQLTPLAIACMQGREKVAFALLDKLAEFAATSKKPETLTAALNAQDQYGWTPLHHAALTSKVIFDRLCELGADQTAKTKLGDSYLDLQRMVGLEDNLPAKQAVKIEVEEGNFVAISEISQEALQRLTGIECYREDPYFSPDQLKQLWMVERGEDHFSPNIEQMVADKFAQYQANPPQLLIAKNKELEKRGIPFYELRAGQDLQEGEVIGQYGGTLVTPAKNFSVSYADQMSSAIEDDYELDGFSAKTYRNAIGWANRGFPNIFLRSSSVRGEKRKLFLPLRLIKSGEPLLWEYGVEHSTGWTVQLPLGREEMEACFKNQDMRALAKKCDTTGLMLFGKRNPLFSDFLNHISSKHYHTFAVNSPTMMLYLHYTNLVDIKDSQNLIADETYYKMAGEHAWGVFATAKYIEACDKKLAIYSDEDKQLIYRNIADKVGNFNLATILKYITIICHYHPQPINQAFLTDIADSMSDYVPTEDPNFPLSTKLMISLVMQYDALMMSDGDGDFNIGNLIANKYILREGYISEKKTHLQRFAILDGLIKEYEKKLSPKIIEAVRTGAETVLGRPLTPL